MLSNRYGLLLFGILTSFVFFGLPDNVSHGQVEKESEATERPPSPEDEGTDPRKFPPPEGLTPLARNAEVWIDLNRKLVVADGYIAMRAGPLEMFACPAGTKEHESVVAINGKAQQVHAGLLAVGAKSGHPVKYDPKYIPATGSEIDVFVLWKDEEGMKHRVRGQEWVRNTRTGKSLEYPWVFAGSGFWTDPAIGERFYHGDGGDFICVSNFPTATLDLPVESSKGNSSLLFEAFTDRIPPKGTPVRIVLIPKPSTPKLASDAETDEEAAEEPRAEPNETEPKETEPNDASESASEEESVSDQTGDQ